MKLLFFIFWVQCGTSAKATAATVRNNHFINQWLQCAKKIKEVRLEEMKYLSLVSLHDIKMGFFF